MTEQSPEVTVVVIGYNDAARLPRAIASVQRQTLRNLEIVVVDDASTDDTAEVVRRLADDDPRIRYTCLPVNSGGCSAPRNEGVALARAPWVMFCDSDDEYERHACKNLLLAAERLDADVVCGAAERVDIHTGATRRWKPELHEVERVADGLVAFPELMVDTISVNKIYRTELLRDRGIRFPEGLLFEDQLFTLEAMTAARRVAVIPETVYRWYVDELSDEPSITQRRNEAANVDSRIEINRRIDAFLSVPGREPIRAVKDLKFLSHDLYLYLAVMLDVDDETATTLMNRLRPYVESVNLAPAWQVRTGLRLAIYHLLVGDLAGIRAAMRMVKWAAVVDERIIARDGREYWACEHLESGETPGGFTSPEWLDTTDAHLLSVPFSQRRFLHRLEDFTVTGDEVVAVGSSVDYDGSLAEADAVELVFVVGRSRLVASVPTHWEEAADGRRNWRASGRLANRLARPLVESEEGTLALVARRGEVTNTTSLRAGDHVQVDLTVDVPSTPTAAGGRLHVHGGLNGAVAWSVIEAAASPAAGAGGWASGVRSGLVEPALRRLRRARPADDVVLFDTSAGRLVNDSVNALAEYLHEHRPEVSQAWVHRDRPDRVPSWAQPIARLSPEHHQMATRAAWLVDDGTAALGVRVRPDAQVIYVADGIPVARQGLDDPSNLTDAERRSAIERRGKRWTAAIVPSVFAEACVRSAYGFTGRAVVSGILRADGVLAHHAEPQRSRRRRQLDLDLDRPVVLYTPALRTPRSSAGPSLVDVTRWAAALGDRAYLVIAGDPREPIDDAPSLRHAVRVLTAAENAADFVPACDVLITDYGSWLGDASAMGLPTIGYQPDRETFVRRAHGLYADVADLAPTATSTADLIELVEEYLVDRDGWAARQARALRSFAEGHCGPTDGRSVARAVEALWPSGVGGGS